MSDKIREAFEAWHRSKFATKYSTGQPTRDMHNGVHDDEYGPQHQQQMWEAWQAALAQQPAPVAAFSVPCTGSAIAGNGCMKCVACAAELKSQQPAPAAPSDRALRSRVADLLHLLQFAKIETPSHGDAAQADVTMNDLERMLAAPAAPVAAGRGPVDRHYPNEEMDAIAVSRYRVGSSGAGTLHRHAVRAGDGEQELWRGSESDCKLVARKLAGAFLDGGLCLHALLNVAPPAAEPPGTVKVRRELLEKWERKLSGDNGCGWEDLMLTELQALLAGGDKP